MDNSCSDDIVKVSIGDRIKKLKEALALRLGDAARLGDNHDHIVDSMRYTMSNVGPKNSTSKKESKRNHNRHFVAKRFGQCFNMYVNERQKTVTAVHPLSKYMGDGRIFVTVRCSDTDTFDVEFGVKLAILRCIIKYNRGMRDYLVKESIRYDAIVSEYILRELKLLEKLDA